MAKNVVKTLLTAQDKTGPAFKSANSNMSKLKAASAGLATAMGPLLAAASAGAILTFGKQAIDSANRIAKMSERIGASTEALSQYQHAAELSGTSFESVATAMKKMQKNVSDAADGLSTAKRAFEGINLSIADLQRMKPEDAFELIGDELSKVDDRARRTQIAMNIFGRAGADLIPMFKNGAAGIREMREEADRLGITLTAGMAQDAADTKDALQRLDASFKGLAQTLAVDVAPEIEAIADGLTKMIQTGRKVDELNQKFGRIGSMLNPGKYAVDNIASAFNALTKEEEEAIEVATSLVTVFNNIPKIEDAFDFGGGVRDFDSSFLKDLSVPEGLQHESMMMASADVEELAAWWASLTPSLESVGKAATVATPQMKALADTADDVGFMVGDAAEAGAGRMTDALASAVAQGKMELLDLGSVAQSVFGEIFAGFLRLGVSSLFSVATGGAAAPAMGFVGGSPILGIPGLTKSMAAAPASSGGGVKVDNLNVSLSGNFSDDPIQVRNMAKAIYSELQTVASHHGPED